ncbi:MAG: hypothetical protein WA964_09295 [Ilumatobacter sp.]|uniref:hypothetical protein n=1 Tax=Ilumatobacter sp. TaxID=1967498 RepID=UPI003C751606
MRAAPYVLYLAICLIILPSTSDGFPTADGVAYISIAENWAAGRFDLAVNGFWSPLLSFLLVPAELVGAPMFLSGQIIMIATGALTVLQMKRLMRALNYDTLSDDILLLGAVPLIAYAALSLLTPDLLMATLLLGYLSTMIDQRSMKPARRGIIAGCWAGAAFLAKAYALPFVVAHLVITVLVRVIRRGDLGQRWIVATVTALTVAVFVVPWATMLSIKYDRPTIATTAGYHVSITSSGASGNAFGWAGILEPTNEYAVSAWEDPSLLPGEDARPSPSSTNDVGAVSSEDDSGGSTDPWTALENRTRRAIGSLRVATIAGGLMGLTGVVGTLSMVWWLISRRPRRPVRAAAPDPFVDIVLAVVVYVGGLSLLVMETRYLWAPLLLTVPCAAWGLRRFRQHVPRVAFRTATAFVAASTIFGPAIGIARVAEKAGEQERAVVALDDVLRPGDRIVTSRSALSFMPGLCLVDECQYWGAERSESAAEIGRRLDENAIDTYIAMKGDEPGSGCEVFSGELLGRDLVVHDRTCDEVGR